MSEYVFTKDYQPTEQQVKNALASAGFPTPTYCGITTTTIELKFAVDLTAPQLTTLKALSNKIGYFYVKEL